MRSHGEFVAALVGKPFLAGALLLVAALVAYAPALGGEPIWDDLYLVGVNPFFKSPIVVWESFRHWLFFDSFSTYYRPVQNWSYMFDYWVWRGEPIGYHLTNILLHGASGVLLYRLLRHLLRDLLEHVRERTVSWVALLVSLAWTVHPIHNAAVAYISGRADSLAAVMALSAWLLVLRLRSIRGGWGRVFFAAAAFLCALLALCAKEIALVWLAIFALHLFVFEKGVNWRRRWTELGGVVLVCATYATLHALPEPRQAPDAGPPPSVAERPVLMLRALGDYTSLMLFPAKLHMERTLSDPAMLRSAKAWRETLRADHLSALGLCALLAAIWLCRVPAAGQRLRVFGAAWFATAFLPISNLFPLNAEVAEHWIYLASIGFLLFLAACCLALPERWRQWAGVAASVAIVALGMRTAVRAGDWVNAETFCQRTIANGGATPRLLATLAAIYAERGQFDAQERLLRRLIERFPEFTPARIQLGACLHRQGRAAEADVLLATSAANAGGEVPQYASTWQAALHLARLRADAGAVKEAMSILATERTRFPEAWPLAEYQARLLLATNGATAALAVVEEYAALRWWHLEAWQMLGELRAEAGAPDAALAALRHAARLDLYDPRPHQAIARLEIERGHGEAAIAAQQAAIRRQPARGEGYFALAAIYEHLGRRPEAAAAVQTARGLAARM